MTFRSLALVFGFGLLTAQISVASVIPSSLAKFAKDPAKGFIDDAEKAAQNLISQGEVAGNGLVSHAGSEIDVAIQNANILLGSDLNKKIGDLTADEQNALVAIVQLQQWASTQIATVYDIKDTSVVDLTNWESHLPFTKTPDFFVQSIRGTAFLPEGGDYHIRLTALGLGVSSDSKAVITATLGGKSLSLPDVDQSSQSGVAIIAIPNSSITPLFTDANLKVVTLQLSIAVSRKHLFRWKTNNYPLPIHLTLYPKQVASAVLHVTTPTYGWVQATDVLSSPITTADKDGCKYCDPACAANNSLDIKVPGPVSGPPVVDGERITAASLQCNTGSTCAFNGQQRISILDNGTHASATWLTCSHSTQWQLRGNVQVWEKTGSAIADKPLTIVVDNPQTIPLPPSPTLVTVDIHAFTGQVYTVVLPSVDAHNILDFQMQGQPSDGQTLVVSAVSPVAY